MEQAILEKCFREKTEDVSFRRLNFNEFKYEFNTTELDEADILTPKGCIKPYTRVEAKSIRRVYTLFFQ